MAVVGVLCMIGFMIADVAYDWAGGRGGGGDPIVATTRYTTLRESNIEQLLLTRNLAREFLMRAMLEAEGPQIDQWQQMRISMQVNRDIGPATETAVVETLILAEQARQMGATVSDDAVNDYLRSLTGNRVTGRQLGKILESMRTRQGSAVGQRILFDALRTEILARRMRDGFFMGLQLTPSQRWEAYLRTRQRATVELAPVHVKDFIDKVADPAQRVLTAFFEQYKFEEPVPGSPDPGFKIPAKAAFQYFRADYEAFFDPDAVAAKEVEDHYEKFKDTRYEYSGLGGTELDDIPLTEESPAGEAPQSPETPEKPAAPEKSESTKPDEQKPASQKPAGDKPAGDKPAKDEPAKDEPAKEEPTSAKAAADKPAGEQVGGDAQPEPKDRPPEGGAARPESGTQSQAEGQQNPASDGALEQSDIEDEDEQDALDEVDDDAAAESTDVAQADSAGDTAAESSTATGDAPTDGAAGGADAAISEPTASRAAGTPPPPLPIDRYALPRDISAGPNPKYDPYWKVEPAIRKELAREKAVERISEVFKQLRERMVSYALTRSLEGEAKVKPLDFDSLAAEHPGITAHETPLITAFEAGSVPGIGESMVSGESFVAFNFGATGSLRAFQPGESTDTDGNRYLFWKTEDYAARVPELDEIRDEVVRAWKMREARPLAAKHAEQLADEARTAKKPLAEVFAGKSGMQVSETPAFSWLTGGFAGMFNQQVPPTLSEVEGVDDPGDAFMHQVFSLEVGDVGVAMNNPQTVAYVVRLTSLEPSRQLLRDTFMADNFNRYASSAGSDYRRIYEEWLDARKVEADLRWARAPRDDGFR